MHARTNGALRMWRVLGRGLLAVVLVVTALAGVPTTASAGSWGAKVSETNLDGRREEFWVNTTTGVVYHAWATRPGGPVDSGAASLGGHASSGIGVGRNQDGRIEIFVRADGGDINHKWQLSPGGDWSGWASLGGQVRPGTGVYGLNISGGRIQVRITDVNGVTRYKWQQSPNCCWTGSWTTTHP